MQMTFKQLKERIDHGERAEFKIPDSNIVVTLFWGDKQYGVYALGKGSPFDATLYRTFEDAVAAVLCRLGTLREDEDE